MLNLDICKQCYVSHGYVVPPNLGKDREWIKCPLKVPMAKYTNMGRTSTLSWDWETAWVSSGPPERCVFIAEQTVCQ